MNKFIQPTFYFDAYPTEIHLPTFYLISVVFLLFFLTGLLALFLAAKKEKTDKIIAKFFGKLANWGLWSGVIGLLITFFRYQRAPYLGMRLWTIGWLIFNLIWLLKIIKYLLKDVPKAKAEIKKKQEFEKYLP